MKIILLFLFSISNLIAFSQDTDGYWDKIRSTTKEINLCANCRTWQRIDVPIGTSQIAYRITLLDDNQKLSSSFSDMLAGIPGGVTKAAALGVNLLSNIAGDDKCRYYIFQNEQGANQFHANANYSGACLIQTNPVNREVNFLNTYCITANMQFLYFAFQSTNELLNERIIIEVVPWIDNKASRGWSREVKDVFIQGCLPGNTPILCDCVLGKLQERYKAQDFKNLTQGEVARIANILGQECLSETGEDVNILNKERDDASLLASQGRYEEAITKLLGIINIKKGDILDYNNLGYFFILTKQYLRAIKFLKEGEAMDETELFVKGNLAHAYLFNGDVDMAKQIYVRYKGQNMSNGQSWVGMVEEDFNTFRIRGLPTNNFDSILFLLR